MRTEKAEFAPGRHGEHRDKNAWLDLRALRASVVRHESAGVSLNLILKAR